MTSYYYKKSLSGMSLGQATEKVTKALKNEGFDVLTEIDIKAAFKKKLDVGFHN